MVKENSRFSKRARTIMPFGILAVFLAFMAVAYACTAYVGEFSIRGVNPGSGTVSVTGTDEFDGADAMTQTVDGEFATAIADASSASQGVYVRTRPAWNDDGVCCRLGESFNTAFGNNPTGLYYITIFDGVGFTNHTTWNNPNGDCMPWNLASWDVSLLGMAIISSSDGKINDATAFNSSGGEIAANMLGDGSEMWGPFTWPTSIETVTTMGSPKESAICVGDYQGYGGGPGSGGYNGNQAPFQAV